MFASRAKANAAATVGTFAAGLAALLRRGAALLGRLSVSARPTTGVAWRGNNPNVTAVRFSDLRPLHDVPRTGKPDGYVEGIANSIKQSGYDLAEPISATRLPNGDLIVTGGYHRLAALRLLNEEFAPVRVYDATTSDPVRVARMLGIAKITGKYNSPWQPTLTASHQAEVTKHLEAWKAANGYK